MTVSVRVLAPNLKYRLSGVTATIARLVPLQAKQINIKATGPGLPIDIPHMSLAKVMIMSRRPTRVWHARRNTEMLLGLFLKHILRKRLKLLFTSASQRPHSRYTQWLINQMDGLVATSVKGAAYLEHPAIVVHHGIDTTLFTPADKMTIRAELGLPQGRLLGCFGRVRHQKGTDLFVDMMIDLVKQHPDITGIILGRATEQHQGFERGLQDKIARQGLQDRIRFCGEVSVDQIPRWYQALDLFIAPQRWEGFGLTPLEAMACGVPVIAANVGAFEELILPDVTGQIIPRDDLAAMIETTDALLKTPERLTAWGAQARNHMCQNFSLQNEADQLMAIYRSMLD